VGLRELHGSQDIVLEFMNKKNALIFSHIFNGRVFEEVSSATQATQQGERSALRLTQINIQSLEESLSRPIVAGD
jgi:hypothetical protein